MLNKSNSKKGKALPIKKEEVKPLDLDLFDENDGETKAERRMWAARDAYDMRDGK